MCGRRLSMLKDGRKEKKKNATKSNSATKAKWLFNRMKKGEFLLLKQTNNALFFL